MVWLPSYYQSENEKSSCDSWDHGVRDHMFKYPHSLACCCFFCSKKLISISTNKQSTCCLSSVVFGAGVGWFAPPLNHLISAFFDKNLKTSYVSFRSEKNVSCIFCGSDSLNDDPPLSVFADLILCDLWSKVCALKLCITMS